METILQHPIFELFKSVMVQEALKTSHNTRNVP